MPRPSPQSQLDIDHPSRRQAQASNPLKSHWVGASAGTGKTKVLTDRVLRLMLPRHGLSQASTTPPEKILCLTFTKTAAAEMSNRIYARLGAWAVMEDAELEEELRDLTGEYPPHDMRASARRLFARALDAPGGLRIMTLHSFCQSVLRRFPVEAGLPPHFELMDERSALEDLTQCLHGVIADTRGNKKSAEALAFDLLAKHLDSSGMSDLMAEIMKKRSLLHEILKFHGDPDGCAENTIDALYALLNIGKEESVETLLCTASRLIPEDERNLREALRALLQGSKTDKDKADVMQPWLDSPARRAELFDDYCEAFLRKTDGEILSRLATKDAQKTFPPVVEVMQKEAERLYDVQEKIRAVNLAAINKALLTVAAGMLGRYEMRKRHAARLDYEDLIIRTSNLLSNIGMAQWVLYKLDEGIDHILVDEAQDTSFNQWRVISALSEEFFAGEGAKNDLTRTLFVVGDEKQSIFSFQGADPTAFSHMQNTFGAKAMAVQEGWEILLEHSFRSTRAVLETVDNVFRSDLARAGVVADLSRTVRHLSTREGQAGVVEIWPLLQTQKSEPSEPWHLPLAVEKEDSAGATLAKKIAKTVRGWIDSGEMLLSRNRPIRAGDVLILVRARGAFVDALARALREEHVPVAGADRMMLTEEICVMDLMAAAQFALQPKDDLALAGLLKSPLIGISEDELYALCHARPASLWHSVQDKRPDIADMLRRWIAEAGSSTPYEFFSNILDMPCVGDAVSGRRAFYARLGIGIHDALDEFLNRCLHYAQMNAPVLQKFFDWFLKGEAEIKREHEGKQHDQVRIMTVHGAKGLQAPIVFLPDTVKKPLDNKDRLRWPQDETGVPLWAVRKEFETREYQSRAESARARQDEEYRRLLYVALTRAEDRLYVCGYRGKHAPKDDCWHSLVSSAFPEQAKTEPFLIDDLPAIDSDGNILTLRRLTNPQTQKPQDKERDNTTGAVYKSPLPAFARQIPESEPPLARPLAPSRPEDDSSAVTSPLSTDGEHRFKRGTLTHRLLELLPHLQEDTRSGVLRDYLARPMLSLKSQEQSSLEEEIMAILNHPQFAPIFGKDSRAEVSIAGIAGEGENARSISGQIDRLVVTKDAVLIVDYKTNRPPPLHVEDAPLSYLKQMAAYRAVIQKIYPGRVVRSALLWTDGTRLMPLPDHVLDRHAP